MHRPARLHEVRLARIGLELFPIGSVLVSHDGEQAHSGGLGNVMSVPPLRCMYNQRVRRLGLKLAVRGDNRRKQSACDACDSRADIGDTSEDTNAAAVPAMRELHALAGPMGFVLARGGRCKGHGWFLGSVACVGGWDDRGLARRMKNRESK